MSFLAPNSSTSKQSMLFYETDAKAKGFRLIAGIDEVGRGPLAGPVVAAAVILHDEKPIFGIKDSKKLSIKAREKLFPLIKETALSFGVAVVEAEIIDEINILQAARLAMKKAVERLRCPPDFLLVDGNQKLDFLINQQSIVGGDNLSHSIAAASVLAKVTRDSLMMEYHNQYPQYAFDRHKGYGTRLHRDRLKTFGPCPIHRRTFRGVKEFLNENGLFKGSE